MQHVTQERSSAESQVDRFTHRRTALVLAALTLGQYFRTLAPGLLAGDAGEFQFAAWNWGLAHPTGYPLYLIAGGLWQRLLALVGISPAAALNGLSALFGAAAVGLLYWLLAHWLQKVAWFVDDPTENGQPTSQRLLQVVAIFGALMLAANPTFWSQSLIAEVYSLQVLLFVLLFLAVPVGVKRTKEGEGEGEGEGERRVEGVIVLAFVAGLALTHHAMALLLLPCIGIALVTTNRQMLRSWSRLIGAGVALIVPLLLYLYIPLRSGVEASPWYHQRLGNGRLDLYTNDWASFVQFISGRSISVGFRGVSDAVGQVGVAWQQWVLHLSWGGLLIALIGLAALAWSALGRTSWNARAARQILLLTLPYAVLQQIFNLFYNIGDIYVYYIPLYLISAVWAAFGLAFLVGIKSRGDAAEMQAGESESRSRSRSRSKNKSKRDNGRSERGVKLGFAVLMLFLPLWLGRSFMPQVDQSGNVGTRVRWEEILDADPPEDAILISNDRNEIVPLFYTQFVEGRGQDRTGLFPLIVADGRFTDIGATIETALNTDPDRPIYLIKPMSGLEVRFDLIERTPPLIEVLGTWDNVQPEHLVNQQFGPLTLLGYDWNKTAQQQVNKEHNIVLYWQVGSIISGDYTTTVQLFDEAGERIAQDDQPPGGLFYGTSKWKVGEQIVDRHVIDGGDAASGTQVFKMLVGMYNGPAFEPLAPPIEIRLKE